MSAKGLFPLPPDDLTPATIQHSFGRLQAEQGEALARLDGVSFEAAEPLNASDLEVSALVRDGRPRPLQVQLYYQPGADWVLSGDCTCPAGSDCRHCAAVAFAWLAHQPEPPASSEQLRVWIEALRAAENAEPAPAPVPVTEEIVYLLEADAEEGLQVLAALRSRTAAKTPRWRKPVPMGPVELRHHPAANPQDRELATLLRSLLPGQLGGRPGQRATAVPLRGRTGSLLLEQLLATGRTCWAGEQILSQGPARRVRLDWEQVPGGQKLQPSVEPALSGGGIFVLGTQALYVDAGSGEIGPLDLSPARLQLLRQAPVIPPASMEAVSRSLLEILPAPPLPQGSSLQEVLIDGVRPVSVLILRGRDVEPDHDVISEADTISEGDDKTLQDAEHADESIPEHLALLHFDYGGQRLAATAEPQAEQTLLSGRTVHRIRRDPLAEALARRQLLQTGLLPLAMRPDCFGFAADSAEAGPVGPYLRNWHHWLHDSLSGLRALGWQVEIEPGFRLAFLPSPAWQAQLSAGGPDGNYFDLSLGIELHGERVDLLPLILRLLKTVPDPKAMREQLEHHDTWLLPLDPHPLQAWAARSKHQQLPQRWLEVPARRLARVLDLLIGLYDHLPEDTAALQLSQFAALQLKTRVRLHPDDYGVSWQAPPALAAAAERLAGKPQDGIAEITPPQGLQAVLRPYQQRGLNWLQTLRDLGLNGILADDMGLGKTVQTLAHLLVEQAAGRLDLPALVVVPTSVLGNWEREAARFAPGLRVRVLHGPERDVTESGVDLILTTYALLRRDAARHSQQRYSWLILDEAQMIKNPRSRTAKVACALLARQRLCLSGTPIENQLEELWSLFHFLMPGFLDTLERFNSRYRIPIERTGDLRCRDALSERVRPLMLRRRKLDVERELPPKIEILRTVSFGNAQRDLYETVRLAVHTQVNRIIREQGLRRSRIAILDALLKLRQICCHPQLLDLPEAQAIKRSAKLELLMELLPELLAEGRRILIFSQFVKMLNLIETRLQDAEIPYALLTGRTRARQAVIDRFQAGEVPVFLISLKAGGLGLNLTTADTVIHYDPWWNPASEQQATDRAWRIGQTQPVFVYRLIAAGTLEESMLALQQSKRALSEGLFGEEPSGGLQPEALLNLLQM